MSEKESVRRIVNLINKSQTLENFEVKPGTVQRLGHFANKILIKDGQMVVSDAYISISCDGVGTKVIVAKELNKWDTIGIDLVAMNANDLICTGTKPLSIVDYLAVAEPNPDREEEIMKGLLEGAKIADITIAGGEYAVMSDVFREGMIDFSGTVIGKVYPERSDILSVESVEGGDVIYGLESSGIHSNGLTLARKVVGINEDLLVPTKIYVKEVLEILDVCNHRKRDSWFVEHFVHGLAHITGGGFTNLTRVCDKRIVIDNLPEPPAIFKTIKEKGKLDDETMFTTFNMGIGFCIIASKEVEDEIFSICKSHDTKVFKIGRVEEGSGIEVSGVELS